MEESSKLKLLIDNLLKAIDEGRACTPVSFENDEKGLKIIHSKYSEELDAFYKYIFDHELFDSNYNMNCQNILGKPVSQMTFDELMSMFTLFTRNEKFCDGAMYDTIKKGQMKTCLERLKELI